MTQIELFVTDMQWLFILSGIAGSLLGGLVALTDAVTNARHRRQLLNLAMLLLAFGGVMILAFYQALGGMDG